MNDCYIYKPSSNNSICFIFQQLRFERRFLPFQAVDTPQPMYYPHYKEYSNMSKMNASQVKKPRDLLSGSSI